MGETVYMWGQPFYLDDQEGPPVFQVGDKVCKPKGYSFDGTVIGVFQNTKGEVRLAVELDFNGMIHIFNESQIELR